MFARMGAKAVFAVIGLALVFSAALMVPLAIAAALAPKVGQAWAYAIAGAIILVPALLWAIIVSLMGPRRRKQPAGHMEIMRALFAAVAKETPWIAIIGAGVAGAAEMFLSRYKSRK